MQHNKLFQAIFGLLAAGLLLLPACGDSSGGGGGSAQDMCVNYCEKVEGCTGMSKQSCTDQCASSANKPNPATSSACRTANTELYRCMMGQTCDELRDDNAGCTAEITKYEKACESDDNGGGTPAQNNKQDNNSGGGSTNPVVENWVSSFYDYCMRENACTDDDPNPSEDEAQCRVAADSIRTSAAAVVTTPHRACLDAQAADWRCRTALSCDAFEDGAGCEGTTAAVDAACDND